MIPVVQRQYTFCLTQVVLTKAAVLHLLYRDQIFQTELITGLYPVAETFQQVLDHSVSQAILDHLVQAPQLI